MSSSLIERDSQDVITRPQMGAVAVSGRVVAEAQAALTVAAARPRDEVDAVDRIKNSCQRIGVAQDAAYSYSRGGTEITGPTIKLLEVVAGAWGNIQSGFRELSRANGESVVEAFAWDLETNNKKVMEFTVRHVRDTRGGGKALTDERDIYELLANMAQRRVRKCLESVIPRDIVEDAMEECQKTLSAKCDTGPEAVKKLMTAFAAMSVTKEQIEKRIQRRIDSITPAQFLAMRKIYNSLKDGMSQPGDWFATEEKDTPPPADNLKDKLKSKVKQQEEKIAGLSGIAETFAAATDSGQVSALLREARKQRVLTPEEDNELEEMANARKEELRGDAKED